MFYPGDRFAICVITHWKSTTTHTGFSKMATFAIHTGIEIRQVPTALVVSGTRIKIGYHVVSNKISCAKASAILKVEDAYLVS